MFTPLRTRPNYAANFAGHEAFRKGESPDDTWSDDMIEGWREARLDAESRKEFEENI